MSENFDVAGRIAAVKHRPATRWRATIGRRMGRKNVRTDDPVERNDTKILEVVVALDTKPPLVVGQRVTGYVLETK